MATKQKNLFNDLTRLFKSGPVVKRKIRSIDTAVAKGDPTSSASMLIQKSLSPSYATITGNAYNITERLMRYQDFQEMELCLHGDTLIAVPGGYKTIKELSDEYGVDKEFVVYSYDHNKKTITPAFAKQARQTCVEHAWKVTFDNGKSIIGTANHRLLKRDGHFCEIQHLKEGDAMMPFYRQEIKTKTKPGRGYQMIYTMNKEFSKSGWISEHRLLASWVLGRNLASNEVVHHINHQPRDNRLDNLVVMSIDDHHKLHAEDTARANQVKWSEKNSEWISNFRKKHSEFMRLNNPAERRDVTFGRILNAAEQFDFCFKQVIKTLDVSSTAIHTKLKRHGYNSWTSFAKAYNPNWRNSGWDNNGNKNPRYDDSLLVNDIYSAFQKGASLKKLAEKLKTTKAKIINRLKSEGYENFSDFSQRYENLKVLNVEYYGFIPLYDLTVDGYKNFATDTVISHNTPEIASTLDLYADECVAQDEKGRVLNVYSDNEKIKESLESMFYDSLNVEFNLRLWARNLCKYGDMFLLNDISPQYGVINAVPIPVNEIEREENYDKNDPFAVRFRWNSGNRILENWEVSHFRLLGNDMFLPYGSSVIEAARKIWRQLILIEDAMLVYRVTRAPERRVFYVDVGNIPPNEIEGYMEKQRQALRSNQVIDASTGRVDLRYNPMSVDEDYWLPVRGTETGTRIDTLAGGQNAAAVEDVAYIQRKLFAALKVPKAYLNFDENLSCVVPETKVDLLDGRTLTVEQIKNELDSQKEVWVYSIDKETQEFKPGKVIWAGPTRKNADVLRVTLDNGLFFDTTPDHKWMLRSGEWCLAQDLTPGTSLMPINRRRKKLNGGSEYEQVFDLATQKWCWTHKLCFDRADVKEQDESVNFEQNTVIHHKDINRFNNNPTNLIQMGFNSHRDYHSNLLNETRKKALTLGKYSGLNNGWARTCREKVKHLWSTQKLISWCLEHKPTSKLEIIKGYGLTETQLNHLLKENSMCYADFAKEYVEGGYKLDRLGNKGTHSHKKHVRRHGVGRGSRGAKFDVRSCLTCESHFENNVKYDRKFCSMECRIKFQSIHGRKYPIANIVRDGLMNHKVISVERLSEKRDTWCLEVANTHNFCLTNSVIISNSKATLAQEDIRFSRSINMIQKVITAELNKVAIIHLYACGFREDDLVNFTLRLSNPSTVAQQQKLELWRAKFEIAGSAPENMGSERFIYRNIWGLNDKEIANLRKERLNEALMNAKIEAVMNSGGEGEESSGGFGGSGGGGGAGIDLLGGGDVGSGGADEFDAESGSDEIPDDLDLGDETEEPEPENAGETPPEDENPELTLLTSADEHDDSEDYAIKLNAVLKDKPVQVNKHLSNALYNRSRRRTHGASKTHIPDFVKMTGIDSESMSDPVDMSWIRSVVTNPLSEQTELNKLPITNELKSCIRNWQNNKSSLIKENNDNEVLVIIDENWSAE